MKKEIIINKLGLLEKKLDYIEDTIIRVEQRLNYVCDPSNFNDDEYELLEIKIFDLYVVRKNLRRSIRRYNLIIDNN